MNNTIQLLKSKIHRATITKSNINYEGSITIPQNLMIQSNIHEYEKVLVVNISNGQRFETYAISGNIDGEICLNGAAARLGVVGDKIIIMSYVSMTPQEAKLHKPTIVLLGENNEVCGVTNGEKHGPLAQK